jgi:hypothetical protein
MLSALLLLLAAPLPPASGIDGPARVELLEGRGFLAGPGGVLALERSGRAVEVSGAAHLELRPGARAALRWNALASLVVVGPAMLEWGPADGTRALVEWRLAELHELHVEVRRGPVRLSLPGGWTATLESGASYVRGLPGGAAELSHDAGLPLLVAAPHAPSEVRPPWVVLAGARVRLDPREPYPHALAGSSSRLLDPFARRGAGAAERDALAPWNGFSWPWDRAAPVQLEPAGELAPADGARAGVELPAGPDPAAREIAPSRPAPVAPPQDPPRFAVPDTARPPPRPGAQDAVPVRPFASGGTLRLTPWGVRRFRPQGGP